ncbi:pilus assembly PilX N-terminal domain-containing protein [Bacillus sp. N9]
MKQYFSFIRNETGYSLVSVLLLIVLLSVLGVGLVTMTTTSMKITAGERSDQSAYYIAEACLTVEMAEVEKPFMKHTLVQMMRSVFMTNFLHNLLNLKHVMSNLKKTLERNQQPK